MYLGQWTRSSTYSAYAQKAEFKCCGCPGGGDVGRAGVCVLLCMRGAASGGLMRLMVFQWTQSRVVYTFLSPSSRIDKVDSWHDN